MCTTVVLGSLLVHRGPGIRGTEEVTHSGWGLFREGFREGHSEVSWVERGESMQRCHVPLNCRNSAKSGVKRYVGLPGEVRPSSLGQICQLVPCCVPESCLLSQEELEVHLDSRSFGSSWRKNWRSLKMENPLWRPTLCSNAHAGKDRTKRGVCH